MQYMGFGLEVSVISIIAVFLTLYLLAILVDVFHKFFGPKKKETSKANSKIMDVSPSKNLASDDELIAAITAAVTAYENGN